MDATEIAIALAKQTLEGQIAPGTIRAATPEEEATARCLWPVVDIDTLEYQLSQNPETGVLLECERPLNIILQAVARSGTGNQCKVLVAKCA